MAEKTRYSDAELEEFRAIIMEKLELAQRDYELLKASLTGTFLNNEILGDKDRIRIEDGAIVTIGATTFILRAAEQESL